MADTINYKKPIPVEVTFDDITDEVTLPRFKPAR